MANDEIVFSDIEPSIKDNPAAFMSKPWKLLIVDDDPEVHSVTKFVLNNRVLFERSLELIHASNGIEARELLRQHPDIAVALLDVVMETTNAGLELVDYMRNTLKMTECRIILRTGQPGYAPELEIIHSYDINDYRTKSELTHTRLITTISASLRSYEQLIALTQHRQGLEMIIRAASDLLQKQAIAGLAEGVLTQLAALLHLPAEGIVFAQRGSPLGNDRETPYVVGAAGQLAVNIMQPLEMIRDLRIMTAIQKCFIQQDHIFQDDYSVLYLRAAREEQDAAIFVDSGKPIGSLDRRLLDLFMTNITACFRNVKLVEKLNHLAFHDPLTNLPNRVQFIMDLESPLIRKGKQAIALLDIIHFADVNNGLGQDFGDDLLVTISRRLHRKLGGSCRLARVGADVFGIMGPESLVNHDHLTSLLKDPFKVRDYTLPVAVTMGFYRLDGTTGSGIILLKRANIALNLAKRGSSGNLLAFKDEMETLISQRVEIIHKLRTAHNQGLLELWFQPQISLQTNRVTGLEALLRWPGKDGMVYPPDVFIPLAEYSGLILQIGAWVLKEACRRMVELDQAGFKNMKMGVNVSMPQLQREDFVDLVSETVNSSRINPDFLELEITESVAMDDPAAIRNKLEALRSTGVQIAIDDFGTGYSSLSQLQTLPIDCLKIDRAFISQSDSGDDALFVDTIVAFSKKLGVTSISEGVETEAQAQFLRSMGCDIAQGYLYSRPLAFSSLMEWLKNRGEN